MNLICARSLLPINRHLDRSSRLSYLPRSASARWWRPRETMKAIGLERLMRERSRRLTKTKP